MTTVHLATIPGVEPPFTMVEIELVEQKGLILTTLLTSEKPAQASVGDPVILEFTEPDPRGVAYPQARATAEVQP